MEILLQEKKTIPLEGLDEFCSTVLKERFSIVHILPFFPYSSDDGFSVIDFHEVNKALGNWSHINSFSKKRKIMFDFVVNHISSKSNWFKNYLEKKEGFTNLAIEVNQDFDDSKVVRPRTLPLIHEFNLKNSEKVRLWTTFSKDQIDLNFKDPDTFLRMINVFIDYINKGASVIRLDAIAYLWKKENTNCIHLSETHKIVELLKAICNYFAPEVQIISETNVPHSDNISYFGKDGTQADLVYNFSLPPLMLHMFLTGNSSFFSNWAKTKLSIKFKNKYFYNFTSSHDGVGLNGARGIISEDEINKLVKVVKENKGRVNYKNNEDGTQSAYEMNTSWFDAFEKDGNEIKKVLASYAIKLVLPGIPAFYINSILGDNNWLEGVATTGENRAINRRKIDWDELVLKLEDSDSKQHKIFYGLDNLMKLKSNVKALHPDGSFEILELGEEFFAIKRSFKGNEFLSITNITNNSQDIPITKIPDNLRFDLISQSTFENMKLAKYQTIWLICP